jgi:hypothetical protein
MNIHDRLLIMWVGERKGKKERLVLCSLFLQYLFR